MTKPTTNVSIFALICVTLLLAIASQWTASEAPDERARVSRARLPANTASALVAPVASRVAQAPDPIRVDIQAAATTFEPAKPPLSEEEPAVFRSRAERDRYYQGRADYERVLAAALREASAELAEFAESALIDADTWRDAQEDTAGWQGVEAAESRAQQLAHEAELHEQRSAEYASLGR